MRLMKRSLLILILPLLAFTVAHKFYLSVTHIGYSEKEDALQITTRIFIDDLDMVMQERYGAKTQFGTDSESDQANVLLEKYLKAKFAIEIDGQKREFQFIGKEYDTDMIICYMEVPKVGLAQAQTIQVQNEILTDIFDEQQNVVHFKVNDKKKSFVLLKDTNKGMLKL